MYRFWSVLFFLVPLCGTAAFAWAALGWAPLEGAWLPESITQTGDDIDHLFGLIHWVSAAIFLGTGLTLGFCLWRFASPAREQASYFHSDLKLELLWSIIPGMILIFIAVYQLNTWDAIRVSRPTTQVDGAQVVQPPLVRVVAKQFGWEFYYAGRDGLFQTTDDIRIEGVLRVPDDQIIVLAMESRDVIHSFFVPELRLKHDVVPGMVQYAWFEPRRTGTLDIVCAELCGWGHYKMNARLEIVSRAQYDTWIKEQQRQHDGPSLVPYSDSNP